MAWRACGSQLLELEPPGWQRGGSRGLRCLCPTAAHTNLTPALGVTELHGGGWHLQPPLGTQVVPSSQTAWCPPYLCQKCWSVTCLPWVPRQAWPGSHAWRPSQALCPQSRESIVRAGSGHWFFRACLGQSMGHSTWEATAGLWRAAQERGSAQSRREQGSDSRSAT